MDQACEGTSLTTTAVRCNVLHHPVAPDFRYVMAAAKVAWPVKTAQALVAVTGASLRTCKYWLAGAHEPSGRAAILLVRAVREAVEMRLQALDRIGMSLD
jgi:hypothetical protein